MFSSALFADKGITRPFCAGRRIILSNLCASHSYFLYLNFNSILCCVCPIKCITVLYAASIVLLCS